MRKMFRMLACAGVLACAAVVPLAWAQTVVPREAMIQALLSADGTYYVPWQLGMSTPPPVTVSGTVAVSVQGTVPVSGTVTATTTPATGSFTDSGCTVGTSSASCLGASSASHSITFQNVGTGADVALNCGGTAALNTAGSFMLRQYMSLTFGPNTAGAPSCQWNAIATAASTPVTFIYN